MCKMQCLVAFLALTIHNVYSWDLALTVGDQLEFYENGTKTNDDGVRFRELTALAYDAVYNMLLFVDKQSDNASIFGYSLNSKMSTSLVKRKSYENIQDVAFDPVTGSLFWTDTYERSIYWKSLRNVDKKNDYGNILIRMNGEIPRAITVDSCRGYIYWTNTNSTNPTIERARLDGTDRKVIINKNNYPSLFMPISIAIDQETRTLYWADDKEGIHYSIDRSDLDGTNSKPVVSSIHHQPNVLTVSKDSLYWFDYGYRSVWKYPKNSSKSVEPLQFLTFEHETPFAVVANYKIEDQTRGVPECQALLEFSKNKSALNDIFDIPSESDLYCVHGVKVDGAAACKCSPGYEGKRCEIDVCLNYCFNGACAVTSEGKRQCRCKSGYTGSRCEAHVCHGFCLNQGQCSVKDQDAVCSCPEDYEGLRCEIRKSVARTAAAEMNKAEEAESDICHNYCINGACILDSNGQPTCRCKDGYKGSRCEVEICNGYCLNEGQCSVKDSNPICTCPERYEGLRCEILRAESCNCSEKLMANDGEFVISNSGADSWDSIRDPIIMVLGTICGLLCVVCAVLVTKIMHLRRRPRIKKRIIVNKNVTPLTARPDQCEITIENCCNMNICETPCFEPNSTIRPTLLNSKSGKEEKKNLIANMEYPDDY